MIPERLVSERAALACLPAGDPLRVAQARRLVAALEEARIAAYLLGLELDEVRVPFAIRADAWLTRARRLLRATVEPIAGVPLRTSPAPSGAFRTARYGRAIPTGTEPADQSGAERRVPASATLQGHSRPQPAEMPPDTQPAVQPSPRAARS